MKLTVTKLKAMNLNHVTLRNLCSAYVDQLKYRVAPVPLCRIVEYMTDQEDTLVVLFIYIKGSNVDI